MSHAFHVRMPDAVVMRDRPKAEPEPFCTAVLYASVLFLAQSEYTPYQQMAPGGAAAYLDY
jgi:hypothetical protein